MQPLRCVALALALQLGRSVAHSSACMGGHAEECARSGADGADDASLIQVKRHSSGHEEELPNFGKAFSDAVDSVNNIASSVASATSEASSAVSEAVATALTTIGDKITRGFTALAAEAHTLQAKVHASRAEVASGIQSAIAQGKSFSTKTLKLPVNKTFEEEMNLTLVATTATWRAMDKSAEATVNVLAKGLKAAGLEQMATSFEATMNASLEKADAFVDSLHHVSLSLWDSEADERAAEVLDKVNASLQLAAGYAKAFPKKFLRAFASLEDGVLNATSGLLSAALLQKVNASFSGARGQAAAAAHGLGNASLELVEALDEGLSAVREAVQSGAAAHHAWSVLSLLLLSLVLALS